MKPSKASQDKILKDIGNNSYEGCVFFWNHLQPSERKNAFVKALKLNPFYMKRMLYLTFDEAEWREMSDMAKSHYSDKDEDYEKAFLRAVKEARIDVMSRLLQSEMANIENYPDSSSSSVARSNMLAKGINVAAEKGDISTMKFLYDFVKKERIRSGKNNELDLNDGLKSAASEGNLEALKFLQHIAEEDRALFTQNKKIGFSLGYIGWLEEAFIEAATYDSEEHFVAMKLLYDLLNKEKQMIELTPEQEKEYYIRTSIIEDALASGGKNRSVPTLQFLLSLLGKEKGYEELVSNGFKEHYRRDLGSINPDVLEFLMIYFEDQNQKRELIKIILRDADPRIIPQTIRYLTDLFPDQKERTDVILQSGFLSYLYPLPKPELVSGMQLLANSIDDAECKKEIIKKFFPNVILSNAHEILYLFNSLDEAERISLIGENDRLFFHVNTEEQFGALEFILASINDPKHQEAKKELVKYIFHSAKNKKFSCFLRQFFEVITDPKERYEIFLEQRALHEISNEKFDLKDRGQIATAILNSVVKSTYKEKMIKEGIEQCSYDGAGGVLQTLLSYPMDQAERELCVIDYLKKNKLTTSYEYEGKQRAHSYSLYQPLTIYDLPKFNVCFNSILPGDRVEVIQNNNYALLKNILLHCQEGDQALLQNVFEAIPKADRPAVIDGIFGGNEFLLTSEQKEQRNKSLKNLLNFSENNEEWKAEMMSYLKTHPMKFSIPGTIAFAMQNISPIEADAKQLVGLASEAMHTMAKERPQEMVHILLSVPAFVRGKIIEQTLNSVHILFSPIMVDGAIKPVSMLEYIRLRIGTDEESKYYQELYQIFSNPNFLEDQRGLMMQSTPQLDLGAGLNPRTIIADYLAKEPATSPAMAAAGAGAAVKFLTPSSGRT